jgi:hypothetical protein
LKRFAEFKAEARRRAVREQLGVRAADASAAAELLRELQQADGAPKHDGRGA